MWFLFSLGNMFCWACVNVFDSMLVKRYEKHPVILMWSQAQFSIVILILLAVSFDVATPLAPWLLAFGMSAYFGDLYFFRVLDRVDVSVSNASWAVLSIFLSVAGFVFFQESWSFLQWCGAALIIGGVLIVSLWHRHVSLPRTLLMFCILALLYVPYYVMKKGALDAGTSVFHLFFWTLIGRESLAFILPWFVPAWRKRIGVLVRRIDTGYFGWSAVVIACFFSAELFGSLAFQVGQVSLVSVVGNVQPFVVLALGWALLKLAPSLAPRELLTVESVGAKLGGFILVFLGLALLGASL